MADVREIAPATDRAKRTRKILLKVLRMHLNFHQDDLAGFALVTWDMRGGAHSAYLTENGMVSESLMPSYVKDCLNRHVAVVLAERTQSELVTPDPA